MNTEELLADEKSARHRRYKLQEFVRNYRSVGLGETEIQ